MDLSLGSAKPMLAAMRRCASLVEFSLMTVNATWPGLMCFKPSLREINLQLGGKIEETRTMLHAAMPALRRASSKLESLSRCLPTPLVRKIFLATNAMVPVCRASVSSVGAKKFSRCGKVTRRYCSVNPIPAPKAESEEKYECGMTSPTSAGGSFARDVAQQFAEGLAERQDFSKIGGGEVRPGAVRVDAHDLAIHEDRGADHFLDGPRAIGGDFHRFENGGVARVRKSIFDFRPAIPSGARGKG